MSLRALALAAFLGACALIPLGASAAAPVVERQDGLTIIRQLDAASPLVDVTLVVRAGLNRQTLQQNGMAALVAMSLLRTPVDGIALEDAVAARGGSIHFVVDPGDVRFVIEALPTDGPAVLALVRQAFTAPAFAPAVVRDARGALIRKIDQNQQAALEVGLEMLSRQGTHEANVGLPALGIPASLAQLGPNDVRAFYQKFYRRGGAFVSAVGRIDVLSSDALSQIGALLPSGSTTAVKAPMASLVGASRQIVAHRDVTSPWLIAQYPAPQLESKDFGPMLVLASFMQRTLGDIAEVPGVVSQTSISRAVGAMYAYDREPANLTLYVNGGIGNPNRAFATALSVASILAATKLEGSIDQFKAMAAGDFVTNSTALETRAWLAVIFAQNGGSADYMARTLQAISTTTPTDLQRVARAYLGSPTIALVLPRDRTN